MVYTVYGDAVPVDGFRVNVTLQPGAQSVIVALSATFAVDPEVSYAGLVVFSTVTSGLPTVTEPDTNTNS
ncbi:unannotated protein [freshwater metagenome]|uniref:Unannotated protein n=1 Tax=freshwater metagenome TaxID=449393 RepID=A0A6J7K9A0_9ZZZZ